MARARSLAGSLVKPLAAAITGASGGAAPDPYAANGFSPDYVADFSATSADFFRVAGVDSDFETAFTSDSEGGGLATMVDSSGNLVWRAHNELPSSGDPNGANWVAENVSFPASPDATGPDGTTSAYTITDDATSDEHRFYDVSVGTAGTHQRTLLGVFAAGTANFIGVSDGSPSGAGYAVFDLSDGSTAASGGGLSSATSVALPNSFYALFVEWNATVTRNIVFNMGTTAAEATPGTNYSGSGSTVLFYAGALYRSDLGGMADNPDPVATGLESYVPTTTAARYLARRRHHRWDGSAWVPTCLHEPVGPVTNLLDYSNDFSQWSSTGAGAAVDLTQNQSTGPDGNASMNLLEIARTNVEPKGYFRTESISAGTRYVHSAWVRDDDQRYVTLRAFISTGNWGTAVFDLNTGTATQQSDAGTVTLHDAGVIDEGGGLYRLWASWTESTDTTVAMSIDFATSGTPSLNANNGTIAYSGTVGVGFFAGFCDLVAGSLPSSHIPTNGSTVPRTADTLKGKAASLPYSSTAMSIAMKGRQDFDGSSNAFWGWGSSSGNRLTNYPAGGDLISGWSEGGTNRNETLSSVFVGAGKSEPFNIACRVSGTFNQVAEAGVASSGLTFSDSLPDLSTNDFWVFDLEYLSTFKANGTVDTIRLWDEDIAEAGLEESTA